MNDYHGTSALNPAFLDRFDSFFEVEYTDREATILDKILKGSHYKEYTSQIMRFVTDVRHLKATDVIDSNLSTRRLKMMAKKIERWGLRKAMQNCILTRLEKEDRGPVAEVLQRHWPQEFGTSGSDF
jgi:Holliday junction resolvasome RuvABC ATP-dependent DNA helicase subunit